MLHYVLIGALLVDLLLLLLLLLPLELVLLPVTDPRRNLQSPHPMQLLSVHKPGSV